MSKQRKQKSAYPSSEGVDRYFSNLKQAPVSPTTGAIPLSPNTEGTDARVSENAIPKPNVPKENHFIKFFHECGKPIGIGITIIGAIVAIMSVIYFFVNLTNQLNNIDQKTSHIENVTEGSFKDVTQQQTSANLLLTKIIDQFDRLFDRLDKDK